MNTRKMLLAFATTLGLFTTAFPQIPSYLPTNGLVGWWAFNGNGNDGSGNNKTSFIPRRLC